MVAQNTPIALDYHFFGFNLHFSVLSGIMKHHLANYKYLLSSDNPDKDEKHREWEIISELCNGKLPILFDNLPLKNGDFP